MLTSDTTFQRHLKTSISQGLIATLSGLGVVVQYKCHFSCFVYLRLVNVFCQTVEGEGAEDREQELMNMPSLQSVMSGLLLFRIYFSTKCIVCFKSLIRHS